MIDQIINLLRKKILISNRLSLNLLIYVCNLLLNLKSLLYNYITKSRSKLPRFPQTLIYV